MDVNPLFFGGFLLGNLNPSKKKREKVKFKKKHKKLPNLSELKPIISYMKLIHLVSETSIYTIDKQKYESLSSE